MKKLLVSALLAVAAVGFGVPANATPIQDTGPVVILAHANLKNFPGTGTLAVVAAPAGAGQVDVGITGLSTTSLSYTANATGGTLTYTEPASSAIGTASGTLTFPGGLGFTISYFRLGAVAVAVAQSTGAPVLGSVDFIIAALAFDPDPVQFVTNTLAGPPGGAQSITLAGVGVRLNA